MTKVKAIAQLKLSKMAQKSVIDIRLMNYSAKLLNVGSKKYERRRNM